jgi:hypothetical protein
VDKEDFQLLRASITIAIQAHKATTIIYHLLNEDGIQKLRNSCHAIVMNGLGALTLCY